MNPNFYSDSKRPQNLFDCDESEISILNPFIQEEQ